MNKKKNSLLVLFFILVLTFITIAVIYGGKAYPVRQANHFKDKTLDLSNGWYSMDQGKRISLAHLPTKLPTKESKELTIQQALPQTLPNASVLFLESNHQSLEVWVDSTMIYTYGTQGTAPIGQVLGRMSHTVDLPDDAEGKLVLLRFTSPYAGEEWEISSVLLGSAGAIMRMIVQSCFDTAVFVLIFGIVGILLLLAALILYCKRLRHNHEMFAYLGSFLLLATTWILVDSQLGQYVIRNHTELFLLSHLAFALMPVPFLLFLRHISAYGKRFLNGLAILHMIQVVSCTILYFTGVADLVATLPIAHILMAVTNISCLFICLRNRYQYRETGIGSVMIGVCLLATGGLIALLTFDPQLGRESARFFQYGLSGLLLLFSFDGIRHGFFLLRANVKAEVYRSLAFTDKLTGLPNRTAFDQTVEKLVQQETKEVFGVIVIDINGLKRINDQYGHLMGDQLIINAANCIETVFKSANTTCYRMGGDEFVVLRKHSNRLEMKQLFHELTIHASEYDLGISEKMILAKGYAMGTLESVENIRMLLKEADFKMYKDKGRM